MLTLILLIILAAVGVYWARSLRQTRRRWLERLDLPGTWQWQGEEGELELSGHVDGGRYHFRERGLEETGEWRLAGHALVLTAEPQRTPVEYDLRLFKDGTIGIHGPGREQRIYVKKRGNVVSLRRPA
jgi:hypothetical protein